MNMSFEFNSDASPLSKVEVLKNCNDDFEWYPSREDMIDAVVADINESYSMNSALDVGAGDGRVLLKLKEAAGINTMYAIEKTAPHLKAMDKDIFVIGTDFNDQNLIDKKVDVVFCNPPFSSYEDWAVKIIKEANAKVIYLILPERWIKSKKIKQSLSYRGSFVDFEIIGSFDFDNADRATNYHVKVDVIKIILMNSGSNSFDKWFDENFKLEIEKSSKSDHQVKCDIHDNIRSKINNSLVPAGDLVTSLVHLYNSDVEDLVNSYKSICSLNPQLLKELDINVDNIKALIRLKLSSIKTGYWKEFFGKLDVIKDRLCSHSRNLLFNKLDSHTSVDFTKLNSYAITEWALKNADSYIDDQFLRQCEKLFKSANVINYKSNQNTFKNENWRYNYSSKERVVLDYRVVLSVGSAIYDGNYMHSSHHGLTEYCATFIDDLLVVAYNLGFDVKGMERHDSFDWTSGKEMTFHYHDYRSEDNAVLMKVRAYKNGNLHIKFNKAFILKLNVEYGRLKGWIRSKEDVVEEMGAAFASMDDSFKDPLVFEEAISASLGSTFKLGNNAKKLLLDMS